MCAHDLDHTYLNGAAGKIARNMEKLLKYDRENKVIFAFGGAGIVRMMGLSTRGKQSHVSFRNLITAQELMVFCFCSFGSVYSFRFAVRFKFAP